MSKEAFIEFVDSTEECAMYTIRFKGESLTEFEKFLQAFRDNATLNRDFLCIMSALNMMRRSGSKERNFRREGKMRDSVGAIPVYKSKLRLYCLRLTDKILILGNGGIKNTRTYNESEELKGYVMDLQLFEKVFNEAIKEKTIRITEERIEGFEEIPLLL